MSLSAEATTKDKKKSGSGAKGLEKVIAGQSSICLIVGDKGKLYYRGYAIEGLAQESSFEEVSFLLLREKLPSREELEAFKKELVRLRKVDPEVLELINRIPGKTHPMAALRTALSIIGNFDPRGDEAAHEANVYKAMNLIAKVPVVIAAFARHRRGQAPVPPDENLNHASNFLYMITGHKPNSIEAKALDQYLILLAEHGFNASTFAARVCVSTLSDMYSAIVAAVGTLKGDLHGSASSRSMEMLLEISEPHNIKSYVDNALAKREKIMGFGHRVYKGPDPRAEVLRGMAKSLAENRPDGKWYVLSERLEKEVRARKDLYCNVDFYSAYVLYALGIPVDFFTTIFAMSRVSGWTAHVMEQFSDNRLIRPTSEYTGKIGLVYRPIGERSKRVSVLRFILESIKKFFSR